MFKKLFTPKEIKTVKIIDGQHTEFKTVTVKKGMFHTITYTSFNRK